MKVVLTFLVGRGFTCMGTDMSLQKPGPRETFATKWTLASLVMSADVHGIGRHGHISFLAVRTFASFLILQRPAREMRKLHT